MKIKTILLTILDVKCGAGVGVCVGTDLFEYLKRMGRDVVTRILNVTSDNGSDATNAVVRLFKLVNIFVGYEQLRKCNHVRCADHSVQLAVLQALKLIRQPTEQLRDGLVKMRRSKLIRQQYRIEALRSWLSSTKPTHVDLPTRWNSTHQMCDDAFRKRVVIDTIMDQYKDDIGHGILKVPVHRAVAATAILAEGEEKILKSIVQNLEEEQGGWNEEILEDDVIAMLHSQFSDLVFDAEHDFGFA
ncbi:hypothetical protein AXG93_146s1050 [Marchantia polymorpha subsp. ruderalis]|uniref:DUF659 domain-containing protein n=1 Tax=Marchantia polymorpha subsp. ruderalis TaxID=1480154 RepID=A0A176W8T6_MARPO|nr:hypothetical protein AXG93_146s1050 [Marchantia polymorpha subsp. ruderalis]